MHEISKKHAGYKGKKTAVSVRTYNVLMQEMEGCNVGENPVIDGLSIDSDEI